VKERTIMDAALRLIGRQPYSERRLRERLSKMGFEAAEIAACLERLTGWGYLNDRAYGVARVELLKRRLKSRAYVKADLAAEGIARELISELLGEHYSDADEIIIARTLLAKRAGAGEIGVKECQKLARAGFAEHTIGQCFQEISTP
jgi:regulatory protein